MKIVATSDTHYPFAANKIPDGDVLIHAGDLMYSGGPEEWYPRLESLKALPHKTKIFVPGNHDFHVELYQGVAVAELQKAGIRVVGLTPGRTLIEVDDIRIVGLPWVANLPGWAFNRDESWIDNYMNEVVTPLMPDIIVSHAPVYNILDAIHPEASEKRHQMHVGCMAYNRWFSNCVRRPKIWINGHIHESYGHERFEGCDFYNVAMCDRDYVQNNEPIIIEV